MTTIGFGRSVLAVAGALLVVGGIPLTPAADRLTRPPRPWPGDVRGLMPGITDLIMASVGTIMALMPAPALALHGMSVDKLARLVETPA